MAESTDKHYLAIFALVVFFLMAKNPLIPAIIFAFYLHKRLREKLNFIASLAVSVFLGLVLSLAAMLLLYALIGW